MTSSSWQLRSGQLFVYVLSFTILVGMSSTLISGGLTWALGHLIQLPESLIGALLVPICAANLALAVIVFVRTLRVERLLAAGGDPQYVPWNPFEGRGKQSFRPQTGTPGQHETAEGEHRG